MSYPFRTTYRANADLYIEDRGFAHEVRRNDPDFDILDAKFASLLLPGQTAQSSQFGEDWEVIDGFPLLDTLKAIKFEKLKVAWLQAEALGKVNSAAGFVIDANERANRDISGLIVAMETNGMKQASFCDAGNNFHEVTLDNLKAMRLEIIAYGQALYARKWALREAIGKAATPAQLEAVEINFDNLEAA